MKSGPSFIHCWTNDFANSMSSLVEDEQVMKSMNGVGIGRASRFVMAGVSVMVVVAANAQMPTSAQDNTPKAEAVVDAKGNLHVPNAYRSTYQFFGSWAVAADQGPGAKELHVVYASPGTTAAYRKNGRFPEGTVLVKERSEERRVGKASGYGESRGQ